MRKSRKHKARVVRFDVVIPPPEEEGFCLCCKQKTWREKKGGGRVCGVCHPDPYEQVTLKAGVIRVPRGDSRDRIFNIERKE